MTQKVPVAKVGIIIASFAAVFLVSSFLLQDGEAGFTTYSGPPKALIIDQLHDEMPNPHFHNKATEFLEEVGYNVDIVTTQNVTVGFYQDLPKMNYKYVVVRTHGAENIDDVVLFTGEKYTEDKYISEQLWGQVKKAAPLLSVAYDVGENDDGSTEWVYVNETTSYMTFPANPERNIENPYFAVAPKLITDMKGKFDDTVFVLGGCNTLSNPSMADSLINKGASMVVGWDETVGNHDNDGAMLLFLEKTLVEGLETEEALEAVSQQYFKHNMAYPANLIHLEQ